MTTQKRNLDIAIECGFSNEHSLISHFKKSYHETPSQFRKTSDKRRDYFLGNSLFSKEKIMKSVLAIDIGGTFIKYGLIHENYQISNKGKVKTPNTTTEDFYTN